MRISDWSSDVCSSDLFDEMMRLATKWNAWTWGIEAIAAQRVLITLFRVFLAAKFPNLVVEMLPLMAGKGDPKIERIKAWVALMAKKEYAVGKGLTEIFTQIIESEEGRGGKGGGRTGK